MALKCAPQIYLVQSRDLPFPNCLILQPPPCGESLSRTRSGIEKLALRTIFRVGAPFRQVDLNLGADYPHPKDLASARSFDLPTRGRLRGVWFKKSDEPHAPSVFLRPSTQQDDVVPAKAGTHTHRNIDPLEGRVTSPMNVCRHMKHWGYGYRSSRPKRKEPRNRDVNWRFVLGPGVFMTTRDRLGQESRQQSPCRIWDKCAKPAPLIWREG